FGDGDFFTGIVLNWEAPISLHLSWRFMGVGPEFEVRFSLLSQGEQTEVSVQDHGALTSEEAEGLHQGWEDFLMRLEQVIRTGQNSRYRWTEVISASSFAADAANLWP